MNKNKLFACGESVRRDAEPYEFYISRAYFRNAEDGVPYYGIVLILRISKRANTVRP